MAPFWDVGQIYEFARTDIIFFVGAGFFPPVFNIQIAVQEVKK